MRQVAHFFLFMTVVTCVYGGMHLLVFKGLQPLLVLMALQAPVVWLMVFGSLAYFLGETLCVYIPTAPVTYFGELWMGFISLAFSVFVLLFGLNFLFPLPTKHLALAGLGLSLALTLFAWVKELFPPRIKTLTLPIPKNHAGLNGFRILHLSDLHIGHTKSLRWLRQGVAQANAQNADVILISGDLIDYSAKHVPEAASVLSELKAPYGVFAVSGNHDFYAGIHRYQALLQVAGIKGLDNHNITLANGLQLAGVYDIAGRQLRQAALLPNLDSALAGLDPQKPIVLLNHQPLGFDQAVARGVDLQLSGHTHAGQIPPLDLVVRFYFKYSWGLYRHENAFIHTSCGSSTWGPPMRLFSRSEMTVIRFSQAS